MLAMDSDRDNALVVFEGPKVEEMDGNIEKTC